jgi:hypothetical protein
VKKGDFIWGGILLAVLAFVIYLTTQTIFLDFTAAHRHLSSFIKFALLASMGELLAIRLKIRKWQIPKAFLYKVVLWGVFGMIIGLLMKIFADGVLGAQKSGYLPFEGSRIMYAFFTSLLNNIFFGSVFMALHKCTDAYIELRFVKKIKVNSLNQVIKEVDWDAFVNFVLLKTLPFFWIPAHTVTFSLPEGYRVIVAAMLSIVLGLLLSIKNNKKDIEIFK